MKVLLIGAWRDFVCTLIGARPDQIGDLWYDNETHKVSFKTLGTVNYIVVEFKVEEQ
jgi:hypothetical protein